MTARRTTTAKALCAAGLVLWSSVVSAGPVIIRDELISDRGITPSLGRGYSIATNTFQSSCMEGEAKGTTPSYDFVYSFESLQGVGYVRPDVLATAQGAQAQAPLVQITIPDDSKSSFGGDDKKLSTGAAAPSHKHYIKVAISIDVYYHSLTAEDSKLSPAAETLLKNKDIPGFFDACGVYFTQSVSRRGTYFSVFSYETATSSRDKVFEQALKDGITGFGSSIAPDITPAGTPTIPGGQAGVNAARANAPLPTQSAQQQTPPATAANPTATTATNPTATNPTATNPTATNPTATPPAATGALNPPPIATVVPVSLEQEFQSKKTTIRSFGYGLGKIPSDGEDSLVAYDLKTFKSAVKGAFKTMLAPNAGIVTAIEVIPWVENPQFQAAFELAASQFMTDPRALPPVPGATATATPQISMSPYAQKRILSQNSEFLSEIDRASRNRLLNLYRAKMCRNTIDRNYTGKTKGQLDPAFEMHKLANNRTKDSKDAVLLTDFYKTELNDGKLAELALEYEDFTYKKAGLCLNTLLSTSFTIQPYRLMPACASLEKEFVVSSSKAIADYCSPTLVPPDETPTPSSGAGNAGSPGTATKQG